MSQEELLAVNALGESGQVTHIALRRPRKRNALSDALILQLRRAFESMTTDTRAVVLSGEGEHFCAGLDLSELKDADAPAGLQHSRMWHGVFELIQFGPAPVVVALQGAVVGGGLELASACHIRVAEASAFYALPEGSRGLFVGGGGAVRIPRLIGVARMTDLMLTGRIYDAREGQEAGLSQYLVGQGEALPKAIELALRIAQNAPLTNYALMQVLPRIAEQSMESGLLSEAMMAAIAQSAPEAKQRMRDFVDGRAGKARKP